MFKKSGGRICGILLAALMLAGCGKNQEIEKEPSKEAAGLVVEDQKKTYRFVDVEGNEYEAPLIPEIPACTYDMGRLIKKGEYRYYTDQDGEIISKIGIDVSEYQAQIDWTQVKDAGIDYAMVRLGYRGYGEAGTLVEDPVFRQNVEGALKAGLDVGVYFFSQAVDEAEVLEEVRFVLDRIRDYEIACPVVFDTEEIKFDTARTDHLSAEEFTDNCITFCDALKEAGYDTMIYANMKWMAFSLELERLAAYEKWYADYEPAPQCPYEFSMWQYTETGKVPGIEGNVDINVWFPDEEESEKESEKEAEKY